MPTPHEINIFYPSCESLFCWCVGLLVAPSSSVLVSSVSWAVYRTSDELVDTLLEPFLFVCFLRFASDKLDNTEKF